MIKCDEVIKELEKLAPLSLAESWDNVGLLIGNREQKVKNIMVTLDINYEVITEAVEKKVDLIISHHPIIFKPLKKITEDDLLGKMVRILVKNNISVYAAHTNLDICQGGLNDLFASKLQLKNIKVLEVLQKQKLKKIVVFIPEGYEDSVRQAMTNAGAGWIGDYSDCTYTCKGIGTFRPLEGTNPFVGKQGKIEKVNEYRLETVVPENKISDVVQSMIKAHPYEEVAYDVYPLEIEGKAIGLGRIGELDKQTTFAEFINIVKSILNTTHVQYIGNKQSIVSKIAVCTGSGGDLIPSCLKQNADVYVTGDIKYHQAQLAQEMGLNIIDAGHYQTEYIVVSFLAEYIRNIFHQKDICIFETECNRNIIHTL
ncbi:MAG: hypothetical protein PWP27_251 [Clostridiales bacterium]|jgi:dinuclear metal center YbgI/SA1388 family protein|nr:hypothetical protein [Clostridiales bacterium]MDK2932441.1 hypothetical protein [Clostridiales bacterium]